MNRTELYPDYRLEGLRDRRCAMLAASAIGIFGGFLGCLLYRLIGVGESELYDSLIERYFIALFYRAADSYDVFYVIMRCFLHELAPFIAVFIGGFTLFTIPVGVAAMLYRGLLLGFSLSMLEFSAMSGLVIESVIYLAFELAISVLLCVMSASAVLYFYPERRPVLRSRDTLRYASLFLRISLLVLGDVCAMLFLIYVYI